MARRDPAVAYGLKSKTKRMRKGESPEKFLARVVRDCPLVIKKCKGDLQTVALVFDIQMSMMEDIVAENKKTVGAVLAKARALAVAEGVGDKEAAEKAASGLSEAVDDGVRDKRLKRRSWPQEREQRVAAIRDALLISLVENEGDIAEAGECLNVPIHEINLLLDSDEAVIAASEEGLKVQAVRAESEAFKQARRGNNTMIKLVLTNLNSEKWADRQKVDIKRSGFDLPKNHEDDESSALTLVRRKENA